MLIAQLGHITELAAYDWLQPNARSPQGADSATWIAEVLGKPHTGELLERILKATAEHAAQAQSQPSRPGPMFMRRYRWA